MDSYVKIKKIIDSQKKVMNDKYYVKTLGIFGSYVRGEQTENSDIDLLVEFDQEGKDLFNYVRLKLFLEGSLHKKVDLVMKDAIKPRLKKIILEEVRYV